MRVARFSLATLASLSIESSQAWAPRDLASTRKRIRGLPSLPGHEVQFAHNHERRKKVKIEIIGAESLEVRGLSCVVQLTDWKIVIDPGVALGYHRIGCCHTRFRWRW